MVQTVKQPCSCDVKLFGKKKRMCCVNILIIKYTIWILVKFQRRHNRCGTLKNPAAQMATSAEYTNVDQNLKPFTGNGDVSIWVKNYRVGFKNPNKETNKHTFCNWIVHSALKRLPIVFSKFIPLSKRTYTVYSINESTGEQCNVAMAKVVLIFLHTSD